MKCPHCDHELSLAEIASLHGQANAARRIKRAGGINGGRPPLPPRPDAQTILETIEQDHWVPTLGALCDSCRTGRLKSNRPGWLDCPACSTSYREQDPVDTALQRAKLRGKLQC